MYRKTGVPQELFLKTTVLLLVLIAGCLVEVRASKPGALDPSFGIGGKINILNAPPSMQQVEDMAIQSDGKIIVVGDWFQSGGTRDIGVCRFNPNGSLDTTFDMDGIVSVDMAGGDDHTRSVVIQHDGKIVVVGYNGAVGAFDFIAIRLNPNGSLDTAFDTDGKVTVDPGGSNTSESVALQDDGKILIVGQGNGSMNIVRLNVNGTLNAAFDGDGILQFAFPGVSEAKCVAVTPNGKILVGGRFNSGVTTYDLALARLNDDGSFDTTFDSDGKASTDVDGGSDQINQIVVEPSGKIMVAGESTLGGAGSYVLAKFNSNGSLDPTFDGDGKVKTIVGSPIGGANDLVIEPDGKYVITGQNNAEAGMSVLRYNTNGSLDSSFGDGGVVFTNLDTGGDSGNSAAIFGGDLIVAGRAGNSIRVGMARYKLMPGPVLSADYDGDGKSDYSIFRPASGTWYIFNSATNTFTATVYGLNGDIPVDGDFDGDSRSDLCLFRPSNGTWYRVNSYDGSGTQFQFGLNGDKPVPGDYDKDGRTDTGVWRPSNGLYYIQRSSDNQVQIFQWGQNGDIPIGAGAQ